MPFIDCRFSRKFSEEEKEELKSELGRLITLLDKPESYLMVSVTDSADMWFAGEKMESGAYIAVSLFADLYMTSVDSAKLRKKYEKFTSGICQFLSEKYGIPGDKTYVSYSPVPFWGWDGRNF